MQLKLKLRWSIFPLNPATHPPTWNALNSWFVLASNTSLEIIKTLALLGPSEMDVTRIQSHLSRQHLTRQHLSILAIYQLLLNQFGPNINNSFQGSSLQYVRLTFVQSTFFLGKFVSTSNISSVPGLSTTTVFGESIFSTKLLCQFQFQFQLKQRLRLGLFLNKFF